MPCLRGCGGGEEMIRQDRTPRVLYRKSAGFGINLTIDWRWLFAFANRRIVHGGVPMLVTDRIETNPKVMMGKPVVRGTRITVELILRKISEGASEEELLDAYPRLTVKDIKAAIRYAADTLAHEEVVILNSPKRAARK